MLTDQSPDEAILKSETIVAALRKQIVSGVMLPGARMPTRTQLKSRFAASPMTVQKAFDRLIHEEFVQVTGKRTYVSKFPPHLTRYAFILPAEAQHSLSQSAFWAALSYEAQRPDNAQSQKVKVYEDVDAKAKSPEYEELVADVRAHRLAGLIFASHPFTYLGTPLLDEPGMPRVAIMDISLFDNLEQVRLSHQSFCDKALDTLQQAGRKRVAILHPPQMTTGAWETGIAARGMRSHDHWILPVGLDYPQAAGRLTQLLFNPAQLEVPDALVICDDNLVVHATTGLAESGAPSLAEVKVVAHCNYPWPTPSAVPATRLGFDTREIVSACVESIDRQRRGELLTGPWEIDALLDSEFAARRVLPASSISGKAACVGV